MSLTVLPSSIGPDSQRNGISRSLALGRILHFEALMRRRLGEVRPQRYVRLHNYYSGQNLPPDNVDQPLMINRFKPIVDKHTSYLWGEYKEHLVEWKVSYRLKDELAGQPDEVRQQVEEYGRAIKRFWQRVCDDSCLDVVLWKASKNACLYGDGVLELRYDTKQRRIVVEPVLPEYFHAMWDLSNMDDLTEVIIAYPIDRAMALEQYGTSGNDQFLGYSGINPHYLPGIGVLWKRWSTTSFQVWVDDVNVQNWANPYMPVDGEGNLFPGVIPFLHVPNMQGGSEYFGYSDAESTLYLQDELNRRLADMGDIVNSHAHPIVTLKNFSGEQQDLPIGPDAVWDLGRDGEAARLDGKGPPPDVMKYIEAIKEEIFETSSMPQTTFGTSARSGSSRSTGLALSMAMMPVVERAREKRLFWRDRLRKLPQLALYMLWRQDPALLAAVGLDYSRMLLYTIEPVFADILPKDALQSVNENVALSVNALRSMERALEDLGEEDIPTEIERIKADMAWKASVAQPTPPPEGGTAGKNSDQGVGGSAEIPGGISASLSKPGTMIKSPMLDQEDKVGLADTL